MSAFRFLRSRSKQAGREGHDAAIIRYGEETGLKRSTQNVTGKGTSRLSRSRRNGMPTPCVAQNTTRRANRHVREIVCQIGSVRLNGQRVEGDAVDVAVATIAVGQVVGWPATRGW
jgi:hypothetical protein